MKCSVFTSVHRVILTRIALSLFTYIMLSNDVHAQTTEPVSTNKLFVVGASAGIGVPTGYMQNIAGIGFTGTIDAEHQIKNKISFDASLGYIYFTEVSDVSHTTILKSSLLPVTAGLRYYFKDFRDGLFIGFGIGGANLKWKETRLLAPTGVSYYSETNLVLTPHIGFVKNRLSIDAKLALYQIFEYNANVGIITCGYAFLE